MLPLCIAIILVLLDQLTKELIRWHFDLYEVQTVIPGLFNLRYIPNTGAAWGVFQGGHYWLAALSLVVLVMLVVFQRHFFRAHRVDQVAFGCLLGGIVGNFIDRVRLNYVVDFLDFYIGQSHFPAFNIADISISTGVGLLLIVQFLQSRSRDEGVTGA